MSAQTTGGDGMFGAVYGDIIGSNYETHCTKDYNFIFHKDSCFTDDSVMIAAVCDAILYSDRNISSLDLNSRALEYAARFRQYYSRYPSAGFGMMFAEWAQSGKLYKQKSYGNGASMRVIPIGYAYKQIEQVKLQAKASCLYTHNHKEAVTGAQAVASVVYLAVHRYSKDEIKRYIEKHFGYPLIGNLSAIKETFMFNSRTSYSVPPAILCFLCSENYEDAVRKAVSLGGDADTMACIAGGIAEAYYGKIPEHMRRFCSLKLDMGIKRPIAECCKKYIPDYGMK